MMKKSAFLFLFTGAILTLVVSLEFAAQKEETWPLWLLVSLCLFFLTRVLGWQK